MVPDGTLWYHMVPYGTIMVPYGTLWYPMVPYGTIFELKTKKYPKQTQNCPFSMVFVPT